MYIHTLIMYMGLTNIYNDLKEVKTSLISLAYKIQSSYMYNNFAIYFAFK